MSARDSVHFVLLPGMDGTGELFRPLVERLGSRFSCRIVDYPTTEILSRQELAERVSKATPDAAYVIVAESYSGVVALLHAQQASAHLKGLVFVNSFVSPPCWPGWRYGPLRTLLKWKPPAYIVRRYMVGRGASAELVEQVRAVVAKVSSQVLASRVRELLQTNVAEQLGQCRVPLMYLRGTSDQLVGEPAAQQIRSLRPDVTWRNIDGPHLLLQREPELCAQALVDYVQSLLRDSPGKGATANWGEQ